MARRGPAAGTRTPESTHGGAITGRHPRALIVIASRTPGITEPRQTGLPWRTTLPRLPCIPVVRQLRQMLSTSPVKSAGFSKHSRYISKLSAMDFPILPTTASVLSYESPSSITKYSMRNLSVRPS